MRHGRGVMPVDAARHGPWPAWRAVPRAMVALGVALVLVGTLTLVSAGPAARAAAAHPSHPTRVLHADLVSADPAPNAILRARPTRVRLVFSEEVSASLSRARVVDASNREVDTRDSRVSRADPREVDVGLPLLPPGVYVVVWRAQSTDDGHVTGGSYYFRIARPDGSVPPVPVVLPTGANPGAGGAAGTPGYGALDGPSAVQALGTWLALLFLALWLGGLVWETWILPLGMPGGAARDPDLAAAALAAERRFRRVAPVALAGLLVADVAIVVGESAALAGDWSGAVAPSLLGSILLGSHFGAFWLLRELLVLAALYLTLEAAHFGLPSRRDAPSGPAEAHATAAGGVSPPAAADPITGQAITPCGRAVARTLRGIPRLPARLVRGWGARTWLGRVELLLGAVLLVAFALSGHAAAVPAAQFAYALGVDLLHLAAEVAWVGGLFYISAVLVPALGGLLQRQRARVLALGLPEFGAVAIVCATLLAATGSLNTAIRLTSPEQFLTTAYGRTLAVKIELFLVMVAISAYHAFSLRPRLVRALADRPMPDEVSGGPTPAHAEAPRAPAATAMREGSTRGAAATRGAATSTGDVAAPLGHMGGAVDRRSAEAAVDARPGPDARMSAVRRDGPEGIDHDGAALTAAPARALAERLEDWLRREAFLGVLVLLCVALLAAFAGSLAPTARGVAANGQSDSSIAQTQPAGDYAVTLSVTLSVTPNSLGPNDFTVAVKDKQGHPVDGAAVQLFPVSLEMDMGTRPVQMAPVGAADPGAYTVRADLTMPGAWLVTVTAQPPGTGQPVRAEFRFDVSLGG